MPVDHYENFPVASLLLPAPLRRPVELVYRFARSADDFADEGNLSDAQRLALLAGYHDELRRIEHGQTPQQSLFAELAPLIRERRLPLQLFHDLLSAFEQDVVKKRYAVFDDVVDYCRRSANPIGRLLLHLFGRVDAQSCAQSDQICSALQLINFLQDVALDYRKGRVYLPQDEMLRFGVTETQIANGDPGGHWLSFMRFQIDRCREMLRAGAPLGRAIAGRVGLEIRVTVAGGACILDKLEAAGGDMFRRRLALRALDWPYLLGRAVWQ
ncbi:MAG TPA: squalene synthase HpnC [Burkholderiales bacterium]|nr:squalene synthase HpnC [Burkholderiales bacterium]